MNENITPLPCPFCGRKDFGIYQPDLEAVCIVCRFCGAEGPAATEQRTASELWDTRAGMSRWRPIETAPRDGTEVFIFFGPSGRSGSGEIITAYWLDEPGNPMEGEPPSCWWWSDTCPGLIEDGCIPSHWMPIQEPPK